MSNEGIASNQPPERALIGTFEIGRVAELKTACLRAEESQEELKARVEEIGYQIEQNREANAPEDDEGKAVLALQSVAVEKYRIVSEANLIKMEYMDFEKLVFDFIAAAEKFRDALVPYAEQRRASL